MGKNVFIEDGTATQTRLDIPSYNDYGKWIVSIHDPKTKDSVAYGKTAILNNVTFLTSPKAALGVAKLKNVKSTFARMEGKWQNATTEEASELAENILKGIKEISIINFDHNDVIRHPLVTKIVEAYQKNTND